MSETVFGILVCLGAVLVGIGAIRALIHFHPLLRADYELCKRDPAEWNRRNAERRKREGPGEGDA